MHFWNAPFLSGALSVPDVGAIDFHVGYRTDCLCYGFSCYFREKLSLFWLLVFSPFIICYLHVCMEKFILFSAEMSSKMCLLILWPAVLATTDPQTVSYGGVSLQSANEQDVEIPYIPSESCFVTRRGARGSYSVQCSRRQSELNTNPRGGPDARPSQEHQNLFSQSISRRERASQARG